MIEGSFSSASAQENNRSPPWTNQCANNGAPSHPPPYVRRSYHPSRLRLLPQVGLESPRPKPLIRYPWLETRDDLTHQADWAAGRMSVPTGGRRGNEDTAVTRRVADRCIPQPVTVRRPSPVPVSPVPTAESMLVDIDRLATLPNAPTRRTSPGRRRLPRRTRRETRSDTSPMCRTAPGSVRPWRGQSGTPGTCG